MSSTRLQPHQSLPAPVVHATFSTQSKSHVLAGVQDAYWSDDEAEDAECPLCLEEMDISDLNFKPCICGYQICRFCWHHIKENLNKRCPACRRIYTDDTVEFKPIATQDHKRLTQQKKQRDRERRELDALGRRPLANVRVVQRNIVYVVGLGPRFAKEELIPTLRSNEYFGQYGKITKILLVKRNSPGGGSVVGLYITYQRREDAARAIAAVDGTHFPGGSRDVMRASYGTTKYCMAFLRGVTCSDHSCMNLHEWGDEKDCFTKEDLTTLKHTMKATESRTRPPPKRTEEAAPLPRAASWAQKNLNSPPSISPNTQANINNPAGTSTRQFRRGGAPRQPRNVNASSSAVTKAHPERKQTLVSASPPSTPVVEPSTTLHTDSKNLRPQEILASVQSSTSPALSVTASDRSGLQERTSTPARPDSADSASSNFHLTSSMPAGTSLKVPLDLSAPPGISSVSRPPRAETASPQTPLLAFQSSYQMSTAAQALLDDVKARRESTLPASSGFSPFPDFDRTLQTLTDGGGGGFSFNLDPKLADETNFAEPLSDFDLASSVPFHGSYIEAFPALRSGFSFIQPTPSYPPNINLSIYNPATPRTGSGHSFEKQSARGTGYMGLFDPFSESGGENVSMSSSYPPDEERKVSRFGFAQGRKASTMASHPLLSNPSSHASEHQSFYHPTEDVHHVAGYQWPMDYHEHHVSNSHVTSAQVQHAQAQTVFTHAQNRLPSSGELSEAQLRSFIQSSQARLNVPENLGGINGIFPSNLSSQPFEDPAIMSASYGGLGPEHIFTPMTYGPPPGLPAPQGISHSRQNVNGDEPHEVSIASPLSTTLSQEDFPALLPTSSDSNLTPMSGDCASLVPTPVASSKSRENADRKAAKKAAAAEKANDRRKLAQDKAFEKARAAKDKAVEKEMLLDLKPQLASPTAVLVQDPAQIRVAHVPSPSEYLSEIPQKSFLTISKTFPIKKSVKASDLTVNKRPEPTVTSPKPFTPSKDYSLSNQISEISQLPLLSKKPKKTRPVIKAVKASKDGEVHHEDLNLPFPHEMSHAAEDTGNPSSSTSRSQSLDRHSSVTSVEDLLEGLDVSSNPFFDVQRLSAPVKMPLEYGPLVHALSALSVGGTSTMPSGSIDNAVLSFQQLLETLTQTISELLRLLPRTTWDDSSSFNGVFHDMLKGDDFLDDGEDGSGKDDEVAALTLALERRARWMEVQLSKLEELHRDINTAAVRAILSFNDNGWDQHTFLPRIGNTLLRFEHIATMKEGGALRPMTADELEKKLAVAKEAATFAETELRDAMERFQKSSS